MTRLIHASQIYYTLCMIVGVRVSNVWDGFSFCVFNASEIDIEKKSFHIGLGSW